tara:strand:- start:916 stop:1416 length:501 start_codon:yes stop_codon:yes gene_type:complete
MDYKEEKQITEEYKELYSEPLQKLKDSVEQIFPNAKFSAEVYQGFGSPTLSTSFYLISEREDQSHNIVDNDPVVTKFIAHLPKVHPTKDIKFKLELLRGGLYLEPSEGSYFAMERLKIPFRKSTGTIDKQIDKLVKYFKVVGKTILENKDSIYKKDIKDKYLEISI